MFDFKVATQSHFDMACRAFALKHNLEDIAAAISRRPQVLRNKLNPEQPHRLTVDELLAITDYTEDATLLDGMLAQINCLPSVPHNEAKTSNVPVCTLNATAAIGSIANEAISSEPMTQYRKNVIRERANHAIRNLSLIMLTIEARLQTTPVMAAAVDVVSAVGGIV